MNIRKNKNCNIKINDKSISNKSAKEQFEKLGYEERLKRIVNLQDDKEETIYYKIYDEDVKAIEYILNQNQQLKEQLEIGEEQYKELEEQNSKLIEENSNLQINWNKLEEFLNQEINQCNKTIEILEGTGSHRIPIMSARIMQCENLLEKIQEIEGSDKSE